MKNQVISKKLFAVCTLFFATVIFHNATAQVPPTQWERRYGGQYTDGFNAISLTGDGGYIAAGTYNGGSSGGNFNYWIQKTDGNGQALWQKNYGASGQDQANTISPTPDGGYIVGGSGENADDNHGASDAWLFRLDQQGNIIWKKSYGGSLWDECTKVLALTDSSFLILGFTTSDDGDLASANTTTFFGESNIWLVKINAAGDILWQKTYGGLSYDVGCDMVALPDGDFVIAGSETAPTGLREVFVCRIDDSGNEIWKNIFGYSDYDQAYSLLATKDNNLILADKTLSQDFPGYRGGPSDAIVVKLNGTTGNVIWEKAFGGSMSEDFTDIAQYGNGYVLAGTSRSADGDVAGNFGHWDVWLMAIDENGNILWNNNYGGSADDGGEYNVSILNTPDNGLVVAGMAGSDEIAGGGGLWDGYIFKLKETGLGIHLGATENISVFPNPAGNNCHIRLGITDTYHYLLKDTKGRVIKQGCFTGTETDLSLKGLLSASYFLQLKNTAGNVFCQKIIKL